MILFASAPQREQHDFKTEQLSFSASNSIWPIVYIYIPRSNPSPAFPMMPQQMPDTEVESKQLFPLPQCCIILCNLHSFFSPPRRLPEPVAIDHRILLWKHLIALKIVSPNTDIWASLIEKANYSPIAAQSSIPITSFS